MKITLIGSGNVAWHLGKAFVKAGHSIEAVYSRDPGHAQALSDLFHGSTVATQTDFSKSNSELFIVAISDQALIEVAASLVIPENAVIAHTSGSMPMEALNEFSKHGVFYALQTFTKGKEMNISEVPFGIEASDNKTYELLSSLALSLSKNVQPISSAQRKVLHVAAVFACNFTNHLFSVSANILEKENLHFNLLNSLIKETVQKALEIGPEKAQTGPAIRGDEKIIQQHLDYLKSEPELQVLYKLISKLIQHS